MFSHNQKFPCQNQWKSFTAFLAHHFPRATHLLGFEILHWFVKVLCFNSLCVKFQPSECIISINFDNFASSFNYVRGVTILADKSSARKKRWGRLASEQIELWTPNWSHLNELRQFYVMKSIWDLQISPLSSSTPSTIFRADFFPSRWYWKPPLQLHCLHFSFNWCCIFSFTLIILLPF